MGKQQKKWSAEFKLKVVLAVLHGEVAAAEIARQRGIHETLVHKWKRQFLEAGKQSFEDQRAVNAKEVRLERELERLKSCSGRRWSSWTWQRRHAGFERSGTRRST